jgi:hypothetical protein
MIRLNNVGGTCNKCEYGIMMECWWQGETEVIGEKPVPLLLFPQKIPHGLS